MGTEHGPRLSVVIPTYEAAAMLPRLLAALDQARAAGLVAEVIVADGGSSDGTAALARRARARVLDVPRGRGGQLAAGAVAARGPWLLFLHADTVPAAGWVAAVRDFVAEPRNAARAATFRLALDAPGRQARRVESLAAWRGRVLGLPYGDQGLLIAKAFYDRLGGYRPIPLMEDVDLVRRIGRAALVPLAVPAVTSAARYRRGGWLLRPLRNLCCLALFLAGVPPGLIVRLYE